jgi:hypothetical protein
MVHVMLLPMLNVLYLYIRILYGAQYLPSNMQLLSWQWHSMHFVEPEGS